MNRDEYSESEKYGFYVEALEDNLKMSILETYDDFEIIDIEINEVNNMPVLDFNFKYKNEQTISDEEFEKITECLISAVNELRIEHINYIEIN